MPPHCLRLPLPLIAALLIALVSVSEARADAFSEWLAALRKQAAAEGISQPTVQTALGNLQPIQDVLAKDKSQPEFTLTFAQYVAKVVTDDRVNRGRALMLQYGPILQKVSNEFGVQPRFIVALWAVESDYG